MLTIGMWISHVTHLRRVPLRMRHVANLSESCGTNLNESCHPSDWAMSHNVPDWWCTGDLLIGPTCEWVMLHSWRSHVVQGAGLGAYGRSAQGRVRRTVADGGHECCLHCWRWQHSGVWSVYVWIIFVTWLFQGCDMCDVLWLDLRCVTYFDVRLLARVCRVMRVRLNIRRVTDLYAWHVVWVFKSYARRICSRDMWLWALVIKPLIMSVRLDIGARRICMVDMWLEGVLLWVCDLLECVSSWICDLLDISVQHATNQRGTAAAVHCNTLRCAETHWNTLEHSATYSTHCNTLLHTATHICNTLQHTFATHCNTRSLQAMDLTGTAAAAHTITIQFWSLGGTVLLALSTVAAILVPFIKSQLYSHIVW